MYKKEINGQKKHITMHMVLVRMIVCGILIALGIILSKVLVINTQFMRISFGFAAPALIAMMYGPVYSTIAAVLIDFLGMMIFSTGGAYFPGFTVTEFAVGLMCGFLLYKVDITDKKKITSNIIRIIITAVLLMVIYSSLNTVWLYMLNGYQAVVMLPARIIKSVAMIPINTAIMLLISGVLIPRIKKAFNGRIA